MGGKGGRTRTREGERGREREREGGKERAFCLLRIHFRMPSLSPTLALSLFWTHHLHVPSSRVLVLPPFPPISRMPPTDRTLHHRPEPESESPRAAARAASRRAFGVGAAAARPCSSFQPSMTRRLSFHPLKRSAQSPCGDDGGVRAMAAFVGAEANECARLAFMDDVDGGRCLIVGVECRSKMW